VEYLEARQEVVLTLGYRRDATPYEVSLVARPLGKFTDSQKATLELLESKMSDAASELTNVICHELLVTETGDFIMVVMTHQ